MPAFSDQIGNNPVFFPKLKIFHPNCDCFRTTKSAAEKHGKDCMIPFAAQSFRSRALDKSAPLISCQPIADSNAQSFGAFDSGDASRQFRTQQPGI